MVTCQCVAPAGAAGKVSRRAPSRASTAGAAGMAGGVAGGMVPVAGRDLAGLPLQPPAVARSDQAVAVPGVSPVNSLLVVVSGSVRVVEPMVSCQPVAPAGAWVGSFTVRVVPLTCRYGVHGVVIGTAVPVVGAEASEPVGAAFTAARPTA